MLNRLLLLAGVSLQMGVFAQTNSPYSATGIGEHVGSNSPVFSGIGNHSVTYAMPSVLNSSNPATYSYLRHQFPIFTIGMNTRLSTNHSNGEKEFNNATSISEIAFGLSFAKRFGLAFGIKPIYRKSYNITIKEPLLTDSIRYDYVGSGSVNKAFIGFSANIFNKDVFKWSVGGNVGAIFGMVQDDRKSSIIAATTKAGGVEMTSQAIRSFHYDLGTLVQWKLKKVNTFTLGATMEPMQNIKSTYNQSLWYSPSDVNTIQTYQYLAGTGDVKGKIQFANNYSVGLSYGRLIKKKGKDGNERVSHLMVMAGYNVAEWSKYNDNFADSTRINTMKDVSGFNVAVQFIPEAQSAGTILPKFLKRTNYRVGYYTNTLPYIMNGTQLSEWAVTAGLGMPILVDKRVDSSIQLGVGYGKRSSTADALSQSFVTINLGIFVAPSVNDRWFVKRKLD